MASGPIRLTEASVTRKRRLGPLGTIGISPDASHNSAIDPGPSGSGASPTKLVYHVVIYIALEKQRATMQSDQEFETVNLSRRSRNQPGRLALTPPLSRFR